MTTLTHFDTPCPESVNGQILQLVVDHLTDISAMEIAPSNLLYSIYQYAIGYEVHLYLEALGGDKGIAVELIVATDEQDPEKVTGYAFGMGIERLAMILFGIDDIRRLYENDARYLAQF